MKSFEFMVNDIKRLKLILNLDFVNNVLSMIVLFMCLFMLAFSLNESRYEVSVCTLVMFGYVFHKYFGDNLNNMHKILLSDKPLTKFYVNLHQEELVNNFNFFVNKVSGEKLDLDPWEESKINDFINYGNLDNPTAYIIYDIYLKYEESDWIEKNLHSYLSSRE
ncbi:hypothetical protein [Vibrio maerlii]|uniref:hypothetical protein n=1 Tax=Vibrio maerlii TaxID=2231648 RepID=UPI000E3D5DB7|nr:hypothetical protein [Vibrio maerlii]